MLVSRLESSIQISLVGFLSLQSLLNRLSDPPAERVSVFKLGFNPFLGLRVDSDPDEILLSHAVKQLNRVRL